MEFYVSFDELLGKTASPVILIFLPIFLITTVVEALLIWRWQGAYPWKNAGVSIGMAIAPAEIADCPRWRRFLAETFGEPELIRFIQQWNGYCLTGDIREHAKSEKRNREVINDWMQMVFRNNCVHYSIR